MTFLDFNKKFPTEQAAIDYFYRVRYNGKLTCPHCGSKVDLYRTSRQKVCICHSCENTFSPFADTIFRKSRTDMRMWFYAIHLIINDKKGISGCQLQRELGVTYKTAWRMLKQIRMAMGNRDMQKPFDVFVEIDETYVGGKPRKENVKLDEKGNAIPSDVSQVQGDIINLNGEVSNINNTLPTLMPLINPVIAVDNLPVIDLNGSLYDSGISLTQVMGASVADLDAERQDRIAGDAILQTQIDALSALGLFIGAFPDYPDLPTNINLIQQNVSTNDFAIIQNDSSHSGDNTRYIIKTIDQSTGDIVWEYSGTYTTDITGKIDLITNAANYVGFIPKILANGNLEAGIDPNSFASAVDYNQFKSNTNNVLAILDSNISNETTRATIKENNLQSLVTTETTRATNAESTLTTKIDNLRKTGHIVNVYDNQTSLPTTTPSDANQINTGDYAFCIINTSDGKPTLYKATRSGNNLTWASAYAWAISNANVVFVPIAPTSNLVSGYTLMRLEIMGKKVTLDIQGLMFNSGSPSAYGINLGTIIPAVYRPTINVGGEIGSLIPNSDWFPWPVVVYVKTNGEIWIGREVHNNNRINFGRVTWWLA